MIDDDLAVGRALACYRVPAVSAELAERVVQRIKRARRVRNAIAAAAVAVAMAAGLVLVVRTYGGTTSGGAVVDQRTTLHVGDRASAVAEPAADLRWEVAADGTARVEQRTGHVFYRVEPGGPFTVDTPAGTVIVTGTCFHVEVQSMPITRQHILSGALGAVAAAVVAVVVYEGGVRVVNANGSAQLAPGDTATLIPGSAPTVTGGSNTTTTAARLRQLGADASRAELAAQNEEMREQLALANGKSEHLASQLAELRASGHGPPSNIDPTTDQLQAWAKNCEIHIDAPDVFGATPSHISAKDATEWGIAKSEVPTIEAALGDLHNRARDEVREIYIAATNNVAGADELTANGMLSEILEKASPADKLRARERMARERAGLQQPPPVKDMSPYERALRLIMRLGHDLERSLGTALGAPRAHELRTRYNAWPGWQMNSQGCEESPH